MKARKDGEDTRHRILVAASQVFGDKGFRDATHAAICKLAGANSAAINYHFGSKEDLYRAAWKHALDQVDALYPIDGGLSSDAPAEQRLRALIVALLRRRADSTRMGAFHRMRMAETFNPTGLLDDLMGEHMNAHRTHTLAIIRTLMGPDADESRVELCEMSLIGQCLLGGGPPPPGGHPPAWFLGEAHVELVADHIMVFTMAGFKAVRPSRATSRRGAKGS
jgi:AcrR family transcriptional regulator